MWIRLPMDKEIFTVDKYIKDAQFLKEFVWLICFLSIKQSIATKETKHADKFMKS